jgi:regulation of enolase protein 1 (concanavalin A-like superfamily)
MSKKAAFWVLLLGLFGAAPVRASDLAWIRAAYWDSRYPTAWAGTGEGTRDALAAAGYEILNADQLKTWMTDRIADRKLSVVVFVKDAAPDTVVETLSSVCTLRRYLEAGGKVVWYADIPFYYQGSAAGASTTWGDNGATGVLGFNTSSAPRDSGSTCAFTPAGVAWGLTRTWTSQRPLLPSVTTNVTILARDNNGNAAAWVKHYLPNDKFRGFVRFRDTSGQADVEDIIRLAEYALVKASNPDPADGANSVTIPLFQWSAGPFAVLHNVYLGSTPDLTEADLVGSRQLSAVYYHAAGLQSGTTYYWRVDEIEADGAIRTGDVWKFSVTPRIAWSPTPADGASHVAADATLGWSPGMNAVSHDVYLGTDAAAVEAGAAETRKAQNQLRPSYAPSGLMRGQEYFWRVDENLLDGSTAPGKVWSFTVRPILAKTDPSLVGWWKMDDTKSGQLADYSGYDNYGTLQGGVAFVDGYLGEALSFDGVNDFVHCGADASLTNVGSVAVTAWVRMNAVGRDQKIASDQDNARGGYKLGVYSGNNMVEFEIRTSANTAVLNRNTAGGTVLDRDTWYHVAGVYDKGKAIRTYVNGVLDREMATAEVAGISAGALMLGRESYSNAYWWFGLMDDVRVYNKALTVEEIQTAMRGDPLLAWDPLPKNGATVDIRGAATLEWSAGEGAAMHDVYFGRDRDAVKAADTSSLLYQGRQAGTSFVLDERVEFGGGACFWRIDEVQADGTTVHQGVVWGFTIPPYLTVDEFEEYTDAEGSRIYETWIDGLTDGLSGSTVGNLAAPFAERTIVHGGKQAMPFDYDNGKAPYFSEAYREFASRQDWTVGGVTDLSIWHRGYPVGFQETAGTVTLSGGGSDIWGTADNFRFAYKRLNGNGVITARIDSQTRTHEWAKAGVMIRDTLEPGSVHAFVALTPDHSIAFQRRPVPSDASANTSSSLAAKAPYWVRLTRTNNTFKAEISADGQTWTPLVPANPASSSLDIAMAASVYIGLAVTSHTTSDTSIAVFSNITTAGGVTGAWQVATIGTDPQPANSRADLYVVVEDAMGKSAAVVNPDPAAVNTTAWTEWKIPLTRFAGVNLSRVRTLSLGVGDRKNPVKGGRGRIYIDDIRVTKP